MVSILIKNHLLETMQTLLMTNEKNDASKKKKMVTERSGVIHLLQLPLLFSTTLSFPQELQEHISYKIKHSLKNTTLTQTSTIKLNFSKHFFL